MTKRMMFVNDANKTTVDEYPVIVSELEDEISFEMTTTFDETATVTIDATSSLTGYTNFNSGIYYDGADFGELSGTVAVDMTKYYHSYDTGAIDLDLTVASAGTGAMIIIHFYKTTGSGVINITPIAGDSVSLLTPGSFVEYVYTVQAAGGNGWTAIFTHHA